MRIGVVLDQLGTRAWSEIRGVAEQAEASGHDSVFLRAGAPGGDTLTVAASLAAVTSRIRIGVETEVSCHPVHLAEKIAVADNCLAGRLSVVLRSSSEVELAEATMIITEALRTRPFAFAGERWTVPALRPENSDVDGTTVRVTPAPVQPVVPLLVSGAHAVTAARRTATGFLGDVDDPSDELTRRWREVEGALPVTGATMHRVAVRGWRGRDAVDSLVDSLQVDQQAFGLEEALLLPSTGSWSGHELRAVRQQLWPRLQLTTLPAGLVEYWQRVH